MNDTINVNLLAIADDRLRVKAIYVMSLQPYMKELAMQAEDDLLERRLYDLADSIRYSDLLSRSQVLSIVNKIEAKTVMLADAVDASDVGSAAVLIDELQHYFA